MARDLDSICLLHTQSRRAIQFVVVLAFFHAAFVPHTSRGRLVRLPQDGLRAGVTRSMGVLGQIIVVTANHGQFLLRHGSDRRC